MNVPTVLAIDTGGPRLQLALAHGNVLDALVEDRARGHAEIIFARIEALLARNRLSYRDLDRLAVTTGPGSFTGLRIGLSAARGLGLALAIPVVGVPTLLALSLSGPRDTVFDVVVDARRDEAYVQRFSAPGVASGAPALVAADAAPRPGDGAVLDFAAPLADIGLLARFAAGVEAGDYPPEPTYIRAADAKPQTRGRVAHQ